jgi:hypothetical protein
VRPRRPAAVVLDNEAVGALADPAHRKHSDALAYLDVTNERRARGERVRVVVPVAVRIEAGWDRRSPAAANVNRICGAADHPLDTGAADRAADLALPEAAGPDPVTIVTSDRDDIDRLATHLHHPVVVAVI